MSVQSNIRKHDFGTANFQKIIDAWYVAERDLIEVRFENGIVYPVDHGELRNANGLTASTTISSVEVDQELGSGFYVYYENGDKAEASWEFVLEKPK